MCERGREREGECEVVRETETGIAFADKFETPTEK